MQFLIFYIQEIADHNLTNHHNLYLNKMSALLSIYINMELRISGQEIIVKILAALYIYLSEYINKRLISYRPILYLTLNCLQIIQKSIFSEYYLELII